MKKSELFRLLGNLKSDMLDRLETDSEFKSKEFIYINTPIQFSFLYPDRHNDIFDVQYITTNDNCTQSFYGLSHYYGHCIYMSITDEVLKNIQINL